MKSLATLILLTAIFSNAFAGGSISWLEVVERIGHTDSNLIKIIQTQFSVDRVGGAVRIGNRADQEHAGERIPPYEFNALQKDTDKKVILTIDQSPDFDFTGRYFFTATPMKAEQDAAANP